MTSWMFAEKHQATQYNLVSDMFKIQWRNESGRYGDSIKIFEDDKIVSKIENYFGPVSSQTALAKSLQANAYRDNNECKKAIPLYREAIELQKILISKIPEKDLRCQGMTRSVHPGLAQNYYSTGKCGGVLRALKTR